jgi:dephospho-CoA kinase
VDGGYADVVDEIWVVVCSDRTQRSRLAGRGLDAGEAERRIAAQVGLVDRARQAATRLIATDGSLDDMRREVDAAFAAAIAARAT